MAEDVTRMGREEISTGIFVARPEEKGPFGRPCHKWEYGTKMDIKEIVWDGMALNNLAEDIEELQLL